MSHPSDPLPLEEQFFITSAAQREMRWPWLRMFRLFRVAIDPRLVLLAGLVLLIWSAGEFVIGIAAGRIGATLALPVESDWPWEPIRRQGVPNPVQVNTDFKRWLSNPWAEIQQALSTGPLVLTPIKRLLILSQLIFASSEGDRSFWVQAAALLWGILVVSFSGGAIARFAAEELTQPGQAKLRSASRVASRHALDYLSAPFIAACGGGMLWGLIALGGALGQLPVIGKTWLTIAGGLLLCLGVLFTIVCLCLAAGWPFMVSGISTEASDGFDGLARACAYLCNRPWQALGLTLLALGYGALLFTFVCGVTQLTIGLTAAAAGWTEETLASRYLWFWLAAARSVPAAFLYSYFWCASTQIYLLLRQQEDAVPLNEIGQDRRSPTHGSTPLPLVGIPAAAERERLQREQSSPRSEESCSEESRSEESRSEESRSEESRSEESRSEE